jgi:SRSO17 transposase
MGGYGGVRPKEALGMDADTILRIRPELTRFLHQFDDCFGRVTTRRYLDLYVEGQLSDLQRKSVEPMADYFGEPPRNLQQFLGLFRWDPRRLRDRLQQHVAGHHAHRHSVGVIDETSFVKKGRKTACVQRQHCGAAGKIENCVVSVHLGYAVAGGGRRGFHTLLDGELYLPEHTWHDDRERCREAGIGDDVVYRSKHRIALEQYRRAVSNGVRFAWMTFDEFYGRSRGFLRDFEACGQDYVAEVPADFTVWTRPPDLLYRDHARDKKSGRPRRYPRLKVKNNPRAEVRNILRHSPIMRQTPWKTYHVKDGSKGPILWRAKRIRVYLPDEQGLPACGAYHLLVAQNVLDHDEVKYFISNAPPATTTATLLRVAFSRWTIERAFEDAKGELGMDHFEVRKFTAIQRHLLLSCLSHTFLAEFCLKHGGGKPTPDGVPGPHRDRRAGAAVGPRRPLLASIGRIDRGAIGVNPGPQPQSRTQPSQANPPTITRNWSELERHNAVSETEVVAL